MALGWVLALTGTVAPAPPEAVEFSWDGPDGCPDASSIRRRIDEYLEGGADPGTSVSAAAEVHALPGGFGLSLRIEAGGVVEQRELTDPDCTGLAEVTALWVAIAVSPELAGSVGAPPAAVPEIPPTATESGEEPVVDSGEGAVAESTAPPSVPPAEPDPDPAARPADEASLVAKSGVGEGSEGPMHPSLAVRIGGGLGLGLHPLAAEFEAAVALAWRLVRLEVRGHYALPRRVETPIRADSGARVSAWTVGARACVVPTLRPWLGLPACAGAEAGQLLGAPFGLDDPQRPGPLLVAATGSVGLRFVLGPRVALWASPELVAALVRPQLTIGGAAEPLFRSAAVGGRFGLGAEVRLW